MTYNTFYELIKKEQIKEINFNDKKMQKLLCLL